MQGRKGKKGGQNGARERTGKRARGKSGKEGQERPGDLNTGGGGVRIDILSIDHNAFCWSLPANRLGTPPNNLWPTGRKVKGLIRPLKEPYKALSGPYKALKGP